MDNTVEERLLTGSEGEDVSLRRRIWVESKRLWRIALAGIIARVASFGVLVVTQSFIGHASELDLAAYAIVQTISARFVNAILLGMSSATETLCGQAFGAGHYDMMGIYLQRSWIINFVTATILLPVFIFATPIFELLGEQEAMARVAGTISLWFIPFIYNLVFNSTIHMFLQAQLKNMIVACLAAVTLVVHVLISWIFVSKLKLGVTGAMGALIISSWLGVFGEFVYIFGGWCPQSWRGFTKAAIHELLPVVKLSISSGVMLCLELWYNAVLVLVAGYMSNAEVATSAFSICLNINAWVFMIYLGFLGSACARVANELGRRDAEAAKFSIKVVLSTSVLVGLFFFIMWLMFERDIAHLFTSSEEVAETVADLSVLLAFSILLNSIQPVLTGVAVGAGLQSKVAYVNLFCYYAIGIPAGILLAYMAQLKVQGLWVGMICGVATQSVILGFLIWRTDWNEQVDKASERLNQWSLEPKKSRITASVVPEYGRGQRLA